MNLKAIDLWPDLELATNQASREVNAWEYANLAGNFWYRNEQFVRDGTVFEESWFHGLNPLTLKFSRFGREFTWSNPWGSFNHGPDQNVEGFDIYVDRAAVSFAGNDIHGRSANKYLTEDLPYNLRVKFHQVDSFDIWFSITMRIVRVVLGAVPGGIHVFNDMDAIYRLASNADIPFFVSADELINRQWFQIGHIGCIRDTSIADVVETSPAYKERGGETLNWREWYGCLVTIDKPGVDTDALDYNTYAREESNIQELGVFDPTTSRAPYNPTDVVLRIRTDNRIFVGTDADYKGKKYRVKGVRTVENDRFMLVTLGTLNAETVVRYPTPQFAYSRLFGNAIRGDAIGDTG